MTDRSPAFSRICDAALNHFAEAGYDGASLNVIAGMAGIRKASLYSHVAGKDELYLFTLAEAARTESAYVAERLGGYPDVKGPGAAYAFAIADRFEASTHLRFLLRAAFLPPQAHRVAIHEAFEGFLAQLGDGFRAQIERSHSGRFNPEELTRYTDAYLGVIDATFVELLYVSRARMERRLSALWQLLAGALE